MEGNVVRRAQGGEEGDWVRSGSGRADDKLPFATITKPGH